MRKCQQCMLSSRVVEYVLTGDGGAWHFIHAPGSNNATWCKVCKERCEHQWGAKGKPLGPSAIKAILQEEEKGRKNERF